MPLLSTITLSIKGEVRKANLQLSSDSTLTLDTIQKYFKKKEQPEIICQYVYDKKTVFIFGYKKGKKGTENKTELPEPHTETVLFGDALVIVSPTDSWETPVPFTTDNWALFNATYGDDDEEEDDEEEEEKSVTDDFDDSASEKNSVVGKEEEIEEIEEEEIAVVVKKKRAPIYAKVDTSALKEEISIQSEPETNSIRMMCLKNLSFLENQFTQEDIRSLEKGIFEASYQQAQKQYIARNWKAITFCEVYRHTMCSVLSNIHPKSPVNNFRLLNRVLEGEFPLSSIPFMNSYEMYPEKWFALKDKLLQREQKILEGNKSRATDQFKCRRCNKKECTYYELQTRSADEPMTIFITCLNCGKEWRQGG